VKTPYTEDGLRRFDQLPAAEAVAAAWLEVDSRHADWHRKSQQVVRDAMPVLARAVERLANQQVTVEIVGADQLPEPFRSRATQIAAELTVVANEWLKEEGTWDGRQDGQAVDGAAAEADAEAGP